MFTWLRDHDNLCQQPTEKQNLTINLSDHIHTWNCFAPLCQCPSFNNTMGPHANENSKWRGAEGTWIYMQTQRPCSSQDTGPNKPWEQADRFAWVVAVKTLHVETNSTGPLHTICVPKGNAQHHICRTVAWVGRARENLKTELCVVENYKDMARTVQYTHT